MKTWQGWMIALARSARVTNWMHGNRATASIARRFIGGDRVEDGVAVAKALSDSGFKVSLYYLGEYVTDPDVIAETVSQKKLAIKSLRHARLQVHLSIDPTQVGYGYDDAAGESMALAIGDSLRREAGDGEPPMLVLDMEDASYVDRTLALRDRLAAQGIPVTQTLQAYLRRTAADLAPIIESGGSVRLVKGAFADSGRHAFQTRGEIDSNYLTLALMMLSDKAKLSGFRPVFGTHDDALIDTIRAVARKSGWHPGEYEFEMLYGVRESLQRKLLSEREQVRLYLPFGRAWWPYAVRRIGESPRNAMLLLRALLGG